MTDQQTFGEPWPPASGLPSRDRMKHAESLRWGETPFGDLSRAELLRLVQAYHLALASADGALRQVRLHDPANPFWEADGQGGRVLARADTLKTLVDGDSAEARMHIDRQFYRAAAGLLFPSLAEPFPDWGVNGQGEWCAPNPGADWGYRPVVGRICCRRVESPNDRSANDASSKAPCCARAATARLWLTNKQS